jgi:hypothetical protein
VLVENRFELISNFHIIMELCLIISHDSGGQRKGDQIWTGAK